MKIYFPVEILAGEYEIEEDEINRYYDKINIKVIFYDIDLIKIDKKLKGVVNVKLNEQIS